MKTKELAKKIKNAVKTLVTSGNGCATIKLNNRLAVCVGWSEDYEKDNQFIYSKIDPNFALVAGLKVWTSDDLRTEYDWINYPYKSDGFVLDNSVQIANNEDYEKLAEWLLKVYVTIQNLKISKEGLIK